MGRALAVGIVLMACGAGADEVYLRSGGRLSGMVVRQTATSVEIEVGAGVVTVPRSIIEKIVQGDSPLSQYHARARTLSANDGAGWLELAEFARLAGLSGQSREAYRRVLTLDPDNAAARRALGYRRVGEQWLTHEEAMQSQGYVLFEGEWVTPIQRDAVLGERESVRRERVEAERSRAAIAEAEARAREAEARARTAEAEAKRAEERERERASVIVGPGIWGWGWGQGLACGHTFHMGGRCTHHTGHHGSAGSSGISIELGSRPSTDPAWPARAGVRRWSVAGERAEAARERVEDTDDEARKRSPRSPGR